MKKIVIFILAFGYILVTIFFSFYQDKLIRKRPMFSLDIAQKIAYTQEKNGIHFELVASRPNLGVIYLPIPKLDLEEQKLTINISVGTRSNYVTTAYDYRSIRDNRGFPVGMPILADSENQTIKIFIRADQINNVPYPESKMEITTRYVFSKIYLLSHPQIAYDVVMYQVKRVFANQWYLAILILGSLVLFTTDFKIWIGICFGLAILIKSSEFTILGILICTIEVLLRSKDKFLKYWWLPLLLSIFIYPWKYLGGDETRLYYTNPDRKSVV